MKYVSYDAAIDTLKSFFKNHPDESIVSLEDIYTAVGRKLDKVEQNKAWISNKLTHLKRHRLVSPVYSQGKRRVLSGVELTREGMEALGGEAVNKSKPHQSQHVSLESIASDIRRFEEQNPSIDLDLRISLKKLGHEDDARQVYDL